jgi:hypothetical protein
VWHVNGVFPALAACVHIDIDDMGRTFERIMAASNLENPFGQERPPP